MSYLAKISESMASVVQLRNELGNSDSDILPLLDRDYKSNLRQFITDIPEPVAIARPKDTYVFKNLKKNLGKFAVVLKNLGSEALISGGCVFAAIHGLSYEQDVDIFTPNDVKRSTFITTFFNDEFTLEYFHPLSAPKGSQISTSRRVYGCGNLRMSDIKCVYTAKVVHESGESLIVDVIIVDDPRKCVDNFDIKVASSYVDADGVCVYPDALTRKCKLTVTSAHYYSREDDYVQNAPRILKYISRGCKVTLGDAQVLSEDGTEVY